MTGLDRLAAELGLAADAVIPYGRGAAKIEEPPRPPRGRIALVSAITPTDRGEGKTTVAIGLADALRARGDRAVVALRQPSLGPLLGAKGGGAGGGRAALVPADRVNVHLTGDLHAIGAAHNLLASVIDHHLHFDTELALDPAAVAWPRVVDLSDRALRRITVGLGADGPARETGFVATAASEVMACLCLARDRADLRARLDRIVVGAARDGAPVTAAATGVTGAMMVVLADALLPNLVATAEGTPALVHGGPFANIAHGCSSVIATRTGLGLADWVVTEAGFGFDLGGEKFFDIVARGAGLDAAAVVLVATVGSLAAHGDGDVGRGLANLAAHVDAAASFGKPPVIAVNRRAGDAAADLAAIDAFGAARGVPVAVVDCFERGAAGAAALADAVVAQAARATPVRHPYALADRPEDKLRALATGLYGAGDVVWTSAATHGLVAAEALGAATWPVCVARTPRSLSDDPHRLGRPVGHTLTVRDVRAAAGAGFWIAVCGDVHLMPGLPRHPRAEQMDLGDDGPIGV